MTTTSRLHVGHGSRACYQRGCRVAACVAANRIYQREYRAGNRGTPDHRLPGIVVTGDPLRYQPALFDVGPLEPLTLGL